MSILKDALESGKFGITAEMAPPKGYGAFAYPRTISLRGKK